MVHLKNALDSMRSHKFKVFISMIWIIIGITSVVVVSSIGKGLENQMDEIIEKDADKRFVVDFYPNDYGIIDVGMFYQPFSSKEIDIITSTSGVQGVSTDMDSEGGSYGGYGTSIEKDGEYYNVSFSPYDEEKRPEILYGRDFSLDELDRDVILLSEETAMIDFEDASEAIGESILLEGIRYEIIGIVPSIIHQSFMDSYTEAVSYVPKHIMEDLYSAGGWNDSSASIKVTVSKGFNNDEVANNITEALNKTRTDGSYNTVYKEGAINQLEYIKFAISSFTGIITLVSLIIGGIGIMNIMYMSVIERKREIGIRRAIGAKPRTIILQFVTEAAVITTMGGFFGIIIGIIVSIMLGGKLPFEIQIDPLMCIFAAVISSLTGVVFGVIPAMKAAKVDPIKAIQG